MIASRTAPNCIAAAAGVVCNQIYVTVQLCGRARCINTHARQVKSGDDVLDSGQMALRRLMTKGHSVHNRVTGADLNRCGLARPHAVNGTTICCRIAFAPCWGAERLLYSLN